jgi:hypothetical protein
VRDAAPTGPMSWRPEISVVYGRGTAAFASRTGLRYSGGDGIGVGCRRAKVSRRLCERGIDTELNVIEASGPLRVLNECKPVGRSVNSYRDLCVTAGEKTMRKLSNPIQVCLVCGD